MADIEWVLKERRGRGWDVWSTDYSTYYGIVLESGDGGYIALKTGVPKHRALTTHGTKEDAAEALTSA